MKKYISAAVIVSLLNLTSGCYTYQHITKEEFKKAEKLTDLQVVTKSQRIYKFDEGSYKVTSDSLYGSGKTKLINRQKHFEDFTGSIYFDNIESIEIDEIDTAVTIIFICSIIGLVTLILTKDYGFFRFGNSQ